MSTCTPSKTTMQLSTMWPLEDNFPIDFSICRYCYLQHFMHFPSAVFFIHGVQQIAQQQNQENHRKSHKIRSKIPMRLPCQRFHTSDVPPCPPGFTGPFFRPTTSGGRRWSSVATLGGWERLGILLERQGFHGIFSSTESDGGFYI